VCPFCRLNFASDGIRKLRLDLNASLSGPSTPSARLASVEANEDVRGVLKEDGMPKTDRDRASLRSDARHLEDRVARIAAKRCSVNEVTAVLKDVDACLRAWDASDEQVSTFPRPYLITTVAHLL
jgi:phage FluMu gp28-like protein